jgi:hypothetical protein
MKVYATLDAEYKRICATLFTGSKNENALQFFSGHESELSHMLSTLELVRRPFIKNDETGERGRRSSEPLGENVKNPSKPAKRASKSPEGETLPAYAGPSSSGFTTFHDSVSPKNYGVPINPPSNDFVVALYDFQRYGCVFTCSDTPGDLSFIINERICVTSRENGDWWQGEIGGRRGNFPSNYVN